MKKHIPNALTLLNLLSGCLGIYFVFQGDLFFAAYAIWLAAGFDFLDGFSARLLKVTSPIGAQLDSLADLVTFGVLPAFIMMSLVSGVEMEFLKFIPLMIAVFAALRLAKFNTDDSQASSFLGMPTPAIAFFVSGLPYWAVSNEELFTPTIVISMAVILSLLMVIPVRMIALKFSNYRIGDNWQRYSLILLGIILLALLGPRSFPVTISMYLVLSLISKKE
jgi:CDP-diacylglycerol--serine O-phosphatidyltransferase